MTPHHSNDYTACAMHSHTVLYPHDYVFLDNDWLMRLLLCLYDDWQIRLSLSLYHVWLIRLSLSLYNGWLIRLLLTAVNCGARQRSLEAVGSWRRARRRHPLTSIANSESSGLSVTQQVQPIKTLQDSVRKTRAVATILIFTQKLKHSTGGKEGLILNKTFVISNDACSRWLILRKFCVWYLCTFCFMSVVSEFILWFLDD